ncbi:hypothetical protein A2U01_0096181, partial [Trifolium medium]|nr:hypothetical protein [Trifolium medium]
PRPFSRAEPQIWACVAKRGILSLSERVATPRRCSPETLKLSDLGRQMLVERGLARGID